MTKFHQHGLNRSIVMYLRDKLDMRVDLVFDGYKKPAEKPFITVQPMQDNNEKLTKGREAFEVIYRFQIGLHEANSVQLSINQEVLTRLFNFDKIPFYDTLQTPAPLVGYFYCDLTAVVPMPAGDISNYSDYHRVYFDVEIKANKYKEAL